MRWKDAFPKENRYYETENGILYCGDCTEISKRFPSESIDVAITDPPYGVNSNEQNGINYKDNFYDVNEVSNELFRVLKNNTRAFVFTAQKTFFQVVEGFLKNNFILHQTLIWFRPNLTGGTKKKTYDFTSTYEQVLLFHKGKPPKIKKVNGFNNFDVLRYPQPQSNYKDKRYHVHQKPIKLISHLMAVSSEEDNLILDSFAGSGTTLVVAEKLKRRWIGIEVNKDYCEIAKQRIAEIVR